MHKADLSKVDTKLRQVKSCESLHEQSSITKVQILVFAYKRFQISFIHSAEHGHNVFLLLFASYVSQIEQSADSIQTLYVSYLT